MSSKKAIIILIPGMLFLFLHFTALISYMQKPNSLSVMYSYPYFHQNWSLFVPPPNCNYNLYVYFAQKKGGTKYIDILEEIAEKHQNNRLKGYEALLIGLTNSIHYFEKDAEAHKFINGKVENSLNFGIMEKFAKSYMKSLNKQDVANMKIILSVNPVHDRAKRIYFN